jgi:hypothetical protein
VAVLKICERHGEVPHTEYKASDRSETRYRCNKCQQDAVTRRRKKVKEMAVEYKGGKCEECGYDRCIAALEFHHTDPSQKDFAISTDGNTRSFEKIKIELDKCRLVCSNCHREIHHNP